MLLDIFDLFLITEAEGAARLPGQVGTYLENKVYCYRRRYVPGGCGRLEEDEYF